ASSASLPMESVEREQSLTYLWDAFGRHGTFAPTALEPEPVTRQFWQTAVIAGSLRREQPLGSHTLDPAPYLALLEASEATPTEPARAADPRTQEKLWRRIGVDLLGETVSLDL